MSKHRVVQNSRRLQLLFDLDIYAVKSVIIDTAIRRFWGRPQCQIAFRADQTRLNCQQSGSRTSVGKIFVADEIYFFLSNSFDECSITAPHFLICECNCRGIIKVINHKLSD